MKRPIALVAATTLAGSLFALAPVGLAQAAPVCTDPIHPIQADQTAGATVELGISKKDSFGFVVYTDDGCDVSGASAKVTWPHGSKTLKLRKTGTANGRVTWEGELAVYPKKLRNSDAGVWPTTFTVTGEHTDTLDVESRALRRSRLSFNAGPEPVRDETITYAGTLERANWNTHKYQGYRGQPIDISYTFTDDSGDTVATPTTKSGGRYRVTQSLPGYGGYQAFYPGDATTGGRVSAADEISPAK